MTTQLSLQSMIDNSGARRSINKRNALALAQLGLAVFPSSGKVPLVPRYNKLDTEIAPDEREAVIAKYREEHDADPVHVGATKDPETIKRMWRAHRDAVPSISCGPSKLVVLDADSKDDGPEKLGKLFEENGGVPEGVFVNTTRSGGQHHIYSDADGEFTNRAGLLKKNYGTDVRGNGGQFVAPGSIREDGKTYGTEKDLAAFCRAIVNKTLPPLPDFVRDLIAVGGADATTHEEVAPSKEREVIQALREVDWPEFEDVFDGVLGEYDLAKLATVDSDFNKLYTDPSSDTSTNRFLAARALMREWPNMPPEHLAVFFEHWEGAGTITDEKPRSGEYDLRQIAREWLKNQGLEKPSNGDAFSPVDEEDEEPRSGSKTARFVFLEDIRGASHRWLDWCIKYFIARDTTSIVSGLWGAGKTAVFTDIALHIAHGLSYRGRRVRKGVCIYVALENPNDVERRVRTWCDAMKSAGHDVRDGAFAIHRGPCQLFDPNSKPTRDEKDLIKLAKEASDRYGLPVAMIVIDTLSQSLAPGDEHRDGAKFTAAMQRIANATGANVTALHHPTKAGQDVRGDGAFQGNVDTVVVVSKDSAGRGSITAGSKFRIGDPSKVKFSYRLKPFAIGKDEDGDDTEVVLAVEPDTGAALSDVDDNDDDAIPPPPDTPADKVVATLRALESCATEAAEVTGDPVNRIGVSRGKVFSTLNRDRKTAGLAVLKDPTMVTRLLEKLVESGQVVKIGENRRTEYRMA